MQQTEAKFAKLAAESRKHPAYWKALAELEHGEVQADRDRYRRWLRRWLREGVPSRQMGDVGRSMLWRIPPEELRAALHGEEPPRRK